MNEKIEKLRKKIRELIEKYTKMQIETFIEKHKHAKEIHYCDDTFNGGYYFICNECKTSAHVDIFKTSDYINVFIFHYVLYSLEKKYKITIRECCDDIKTHNKQSIQNNGIDKVYKKLSTHVKEYVKMQIDDFIKMHQHAMVFNIHIQRMGFVIECTVCQNNKEIDTINIDKFCRECVDVLHEMRKKYNIEFEFYKHIVSFLLDIAGIDKCELHISYFTAHIKDEITAFVEKHKNKCHSHAFKIIPLDSNYSCFRIRCSKCAKDKELSVADKIHMHKELLGLTLLDILRDHNFDITFVICENKT